METMAVGILGCGVIAPAYLKNLQTHFSKMVRVVACADTVLEVAKKRAAEFNIPNACSPEELLAHPGVELIINLTPAPIHAATNLSILRAGKHLFSEKPLALSRAEGKAILQLAGERSLQVGGAADTFLGAGLQLCRELIDTGRIGVPMAAHAIISLGMYHSARYHQVFRGALLDLGPYYITALVALLGPIARVAGAAEIRFPEKPFPLDGPEAGQTFKVDLPSSVAAALTFADGTVAALVASCDLSGYFPRVEIHGTEGTLVLNDANFYGGKVILNRPAGPEVIEPNKGFSGEGRGLGVAEMAMAIRAQRTPRSSGELMYHALDAMLAVHDSSREGKIHQLDSRVERPAPFEFK